MSIKNYCLPFKDNPVNFVDVLNGKYSNLNLNQNYKCSSTNLIILSKHGSNEKFKNNALIVFNEINNIQTSKNSNSWINSRKIASSKFLNFKNESKGLKEQNAPNTTNRSTISLHIAAYENFGEDNTVIFGDTNNGIKINERESVMKKQFLYGSISNIQNSFEFPRQQKEEEEPNNPELMEFKANQRLLDPNESVINCNTPPETTNWDMDISEDDEVFIKDMVEDSVPQTLNIVAETTALISSQIQQQLPIGDSNISHYQTSMVILNMAKEIAPDVKSVLTDVFGDFENFSKIQKRTDTNHCPFLAPSKYSDPDGKLKKMADTIKLNNERQKNEVERIKKSAEEKQRFEREKTEYNIWFERRKAHQSRSSEPFMQPPPKVSQKVLDLYAQKDREMLAQSLLPPPLLPLDEVMNNGNNSETPTSSSFSMPSSSKRPHSKEKKSSHREKHEKNHQDSKPTILEPPPMPSLIKEEPTDEVKESPKDLFGDLSPVYEAALRDEKAVSEISIASSATLTQNVSVTKQADLMVDLFGDDEEFERIESTVSSSSRVATPLSPKVEPSSPKASPTISPPAKRIKLSPSVPPPPPPPLSPTPSSSAIATCSTTTATTLSPTKLHKPKKEKKEKREKKEKKAKKEKKEKKDKHREDEPGRSTEPDQEREKEKKKHKKHKKKDKEERE